MIKTLPLEDLTKNTKTLYEAVEVIAKRARQINNLRRSNLQMIDEGEDQIEENFEDLTIEVQDQIYERKVKPTRQAIVDLINGDVNIKYPSDEEEEQEG